MSSPPDPLGHLAEIRSLIVLIVLSLLFSARRAARCSSSAPAVTTRCLPSTATDLCGLHVQRARTSTPSQRTYEEPISFESGRRSLSQVVSRTASKLKELDDVLGSDDSWQNVDKTSGACFPQSYYCERKQLSQQNMIAECAKCHHPDAYFMQIQIRSADEPMTTFYKCANSACGNVWREQ